MFCKKIPIKAIGFTVNSNLLNYAIVSLRGDKITVEETQTIDTHCKIALQRLQSFFKKNPSCFVFSSLAQKICFPPETVLKKVDQQKIVKNKIETQFKMNEVGLLPLFCHKVKKASFISYPKDSLSPNLYTTSHLAKKASKIIFDTEALCTLSQFSNNLNDKIVLWMTSKALKVVVLKEKQWVFCTQKKFENKLSEKVKNDLLRLVEGIKNEFSISDMELYLEPNIKEEVMKVLKSSFSGSVLDKNNKGFFKENMAYAIEIGAALSVVKHPSLQMAKPSFKKVYDIFRRPIKQHILLFFMLFLSFYFIWEVKILHLKKINEKMWHEAAFFHKYPLDSDLFLANLDIKTSCEMKRIKSPQFLLEPYIPGPSDTLAWLSHFFEGHEIKSIQDFGLNSLDYTLTKHPCIKNTQLHYEAKVDLSFNMNPSQTQHLRKKLQRSKNFINSHKKVDWNYKKNTHKVSFYLTDS